jgi:FtsP/CotA-like multicopper oxidase with cupredoxin domain
MDGAFGITQCGIQPKGKFVYRFQVNQGPGTYWWHSHAPEQYADGLYGAFIIEEEEEEEKEFAGDYVVFIQDWHHETYHTNSAKYLNRIGEFPGFVPNYPWPSENVIINGRGQFECKWISEEDCIDIRKWGWNWFLKNASKMPEPTLREEQSGQCQPIRPPFIGRCIPKPKRLPRSCYEPKTLPDKSEDVLDFGDCPSLNASEYSELICYPGKKIKIRLINSGESLPLKFWVDRHNLTIISKDGVKVVPDGLGSTIRVGVELFKRSSAFISVFCFHCFRVLSRFVFKTTFPVCLWNFKIFYKFIRSTRKEKISVSFVLSFWM